MLAICKFVAAMIVRCILFTLWFYIIYKVVFDFIVPIFRTTQKIRQQFGDMQQQMQDQMNATQNGYRNNTSPSQPPPSNEQKAKAGDYIDFEEVK